MKKNRKDCNLRSCFLCKLCLPEWLPAIEANKKTIHFKKGETIFKEGDKVKGIYFVFTGTVKVHKKWGNEKELIIRFAKDGDIFGHRGLGDEVIYPVSGTALESTTVCFIDLDFFKTTIRINNDFTIRLLMFYADELQRSEKKMNNLAHMQVKGRIAYCLLSLKNKFGVTTDGAININLTRQHLASYAGTTYETVFRILNELAQDEILSIDNKNILILDEIQLVNLTKESD
ncbi:MAG: Crp/Fnr family transcriptional regulator [Ferruginibacter sp.]